MTKRWEIIISDNIKMMKYRFDRRKGNIKKDIRGHIKIMRVWLRVWCVCVLILWDDINLDYVLFSFGYNMNDR
jgi:hypothetical protein